MFDLRIEPHMFGVLHTDNVPRVLTRDLGLSLGRHLLTSLPDLLIVEAHPQPGWLADLALQVEQVVEERVVENTHLANS